MSYTEGLVNGMAAYIAIQVVLTVDGGERPPLWAVAILLYVAVMWAASILRA
jgi:hypothetical protein